MRLEVHAAPRGRVGFEFERSQHLGRDAETDEQSDAWAVPIEKSACSSAVK
jgi:hypothetical protein